MTTVNNTVFWDLSQGIDLLAGSELSNTEYRILRFILNRTLKYNKPEERIPYRHFLEGVWDGAGRVVIAPVPCDKKTVTKTLRSLAAKGLIAITADKDLAGSNFVKVLIDKLKALLQMCALKISKKIKAVQDGRGGGESNPWGEGKVTPGVGESNPYKQTKYKQTENKQTEEEAIALPRDAAGVREVIQKIRLRHAAKNQDVLSTPEACTAAALARTWNAALAIYAKEHEQAPIAKLSIYAAGVLRRALSTMPLFGGHDWKPYIADVVIRWDEYISHFRATWPNKNYPFPLLPTVRFFVSQSAPAFAPHYYDRISGAVAARRVSEDNRVARATRKTQDAEATIARLREEVGRAQRAAAEAQSDRNRALSALADRRQAARLPRTRPTPEQVQQAFSEDLPEWDDEAS